jgi:hypothetical protein
MYIVLVAKPVNTMEGDEKGRERTDSSESDSEAHGESD